jgi:anti-sigma factor RsiW
MNSDEPSANRELADLLPFYLTGRLPVSEVKRLEIALATDEALRIELALVEEERAATVEANESLGRPSSRAGARFLAALEAEPARATPRALASSLIAWVGERLQSLTPRQMAYAGIAAALVVLAQAGLIGALIEGTGGETYTQASVRGAPNEGSLATIAFSTDANAAEISSLLEAAHVTIVDGPKPGGLYVLRLGPKEMAKGDRDALIARLGAQKSLVRFVAPSP